MTTTPTIFKAQQKVDFIPDGGDQQDPAIVRLGNNRFLMAWTESADGPVGTGAGTNIVGRIFNFEGSFESSIFQLNFLSGDDERNAALASLPDGGFIVVYEDHNASGTSIRADTYHVNGAHNRSFTVQADTNSDVLANPSVRVWSDGSFSFYYTRNDALKEWRFTASGAPAGVEIGRSSGLYEISNPDADTSANGVGILGYEKILADGSQLDHDVWFEGPGTFLLSDALDQRDPHVAALAGGGYAAVWWEANLDSTNDRIRAMVVGADGSLVRDVFTVNTIGAGSQNDPDVAALPDGGFVVTWDDDELARIQSQRFDDLGQPVGVQFTSGAEGTEENPVIATLQDGRFVVGFQQITGNDDIWATIFDPRTSPIGGTENRDFMVSRRDGAVVKGFAGDDEIIGYEGSDVLDGGRDDDRLTPGGGADRLIGGRGADWITIRRENALADAMAGIFDRITDHNQGNTGIFDPAEGDRLDVSTLTTEALDDGEPISSLARVVRDSIDGSSVLQVDPDGTAGGANWLTVARLDGIDTGHGAKVVVDFAAGFPPVDIFAQEGNATTQLANFDGALGSDLLWRNDNGMVGMWTMDGPSILTPRDIALVGREWHIAGMADFGGDDRGDILWRRDDGLVGLWQMNGSAVTSAGDIMMVDDAWRVVGTADFGGDGRDDILWRHDNGTVGLWEMNGTGVLLAGNIHVVDNAWSIAGTGDFGGDGRSDILWRHKDGTVGLWQMNGIRVLSAGDIQEVSSDWHIAATGDFNGDNRTDILWRNDSGMVGIWTMNGASVVSAENIMEVDSGWHIVGTGDFNDDDRSDILWNHEDGTVGIWEMDGSSVLLAQTVSTVASQWTNVAHHNDLV